MEQQPANSSWTENLAGAIEARYSESASDSNDNTDNNQPPTGVPDGDLSGRHTPDEVNQRAPQHPDTTTTSTNHEDGHFVLRLTGGGGESSAEEEEPTSAAAAAAASDSLDQGIVREPPRAPYYLQASIHSVNGSRSNIISAATTWYLSRYGPGTGRSTATRLTRMMS